MKPRVALIVTLALGCGARMPPPSAPKTQSAASPTNPAIAAVDDGVERYAVPAGGPSRGLATAKVTIVEFTDFQCPFCARAVATLEQITREYPNDVRIFFRHDPLPFHPNARPAAEAAVAAATQGKFWQMHDKLFANQGQLDAESLERYARDVGLDSSRRRTERDRGLVTTLVDTDIAIAAGLGVEGTPTFFVNGRLVSGAQPFAVFKEVIDAEIAHASTLLAAGVAPEALYATMLAKAKPRLPTEKKTKATASAEVYKLQIGDAPRRGGALPKVTIIEFTDFQCPFCALAEKTLATLLRDYGDDLAVVFRHNPLGFHERAMPAALAAEAAREQGKFWEMHDRLFDAQDHLDADALADHARALGLDMKRFAASMAGPLAKKRVRRDVDEAVRFGVKGTPNFFINGRNVRGAQPLAAFKAVIDAELKAADEKLAAGTQRVNLYAAFIENGTIPPAPPNENERFRAEIGHAPLRGAKDALVTIVEWADFQCPFCARVETSLRKILQEYPGQVRVAWRDLPLPFHEKAKLAALAARAAGEQGKFWEMHDRLLGDQAHLDRETYVRYAEELGLDGKTFAAALDAERGGDAVEEDAADAGTLGARGTPTFFINGKRLVGAQPFETFAAKIDAELEIAQALVAKGTPRSKVYAALMKDAKLRAADAKAVDKAPEDDATVYEVSAGAAPSKGPKDAALEVVFFADFQCPFSKRAEPTLRRLEEEYPGQVRLVWKNFPLTFHENAELAAEAAMAAEAQGKFWPMYDKLWSASPALDREHLEQYARELHLDLPRFRADLAQGRYHDRIEADVKEGQRIVVAGTPAIFINGRRIAGAYPWETFKKIADQELAKKKAVNLKHAKAA